MRVLAIGGGGVAVQIAAQVVALDEGGQASVPRGLELAPLLAQFRRDPRQAEGLVDARLGVAGDAGVVLDAEQAVLVQLESLAYRAIAKLDVVRLAAGEVLQRGATRGWRHQPQIGLQALAETDAALGRPLPEDTLHAPERHEVFHHLGAGTGRQHVEITARLGAAPEAADEIEGGVRTDGPADA